jgi:hypothetical protein
MDFTAPDENALAIDHQGVFIPSDLSWASICLFNLGPDVLQLTTF